jgi:RNA polymerase sigma-70 factor (ECF subfamily)
MVALALLTTARREARIDADGGLVLLGDQDRTRWDQQQIREGLELVDSTLRKGRPGPYQIQAAIAACHASATVASDTDWSQIALLYDELLRFEPTPVVAANRAIAVAEAEGPAAGLMILEALADHPQLSRWPAFHVARAGLLTRLARNNDAIVAYRMALHLEPPPAECAFIVGQLVRLTGTNSAKEKRSP